MRIVRRLMNMFASSGGGRRRSRGRSGGLMSIVSRFLGGGSRRSRRI